MSKDVFTCTSPSCPHVEEGEKSGGVKERGSLCGDNGDSGVEDREGTSSSYTLQNENKNENTHMYIPIFTCYEGSQGSGVWEWDNLEGVYTLYLVLSFLKKIHAHV